MLSVLNWGMYPEEGLLVEGEQLVVSVSLPQRSPAHRAEKMLSCKSVYFTKAEKWRELKKRLEI